VIYLESNLSTYEARKRAAVLRADHAGQLRCRRILTNGVVVVACCLLPHPTGLCRYIDRVGRSHATDGHWRLL
jgi:hypothetical protein